MKRVMVWIFLTIFLIAGAFAQSLEANHVISNSENWRDVYSSILYGNLKGIGSDFLVSTQHGTLILNDLNKNSRILVISSTTLPFVFSYPDLIKSKGFASAEEQIVENANLELIEKLPEIKNFIIIDDSYGFSAIAVAPYAKLTKSWVFFSNRGNIAEIDQIISSKNPEKIILYGYVDKIVEDTLSKYSPEVINTGDRFKDNIEIVKNFISIKSSEQVLLTNGEFIEKELIAGTFPVLFTGRENVPEQIAEYLKSSKIKVGVLIGNELIGAATNIRRSTGLSVMVKFARDARSPAGGISAVEGLDIFPLPSPTTKLSLHSIKYNKLSSSLEVTYKSESDIPIYLKGTITLSWGSEKTRVGDVEPIFISPNDYKTVTYSGVSILSDDINAELLTLYGDVPTSLDKVLKEKLKVSAVNVLDNCEIDENSIDYVRYNTKKEQFKIKVRNNGAAGCWIDLELSDILIGNLKRTLGTEGSLELKSGASEIIKINEILDSEDLDKNSFIDLKAYHGEKEDSLVKMFKGKFPLELEKTGWLVYVIIALIVIVILLILAKRRRKD